MYSLNPYETGRVLGATGGVKSWVLEFCELGVKMGLKDLGVGDGGASLGL